MKLIRLTKDTRIKSFDCGTETNESEEYPFMASYNNDELVNHVLAREEEYAENWRKIVAKNFGSSVFNRTFATDS